MKQKKNSFRIAMAIVAMATLGVVITSCSKEDDILNDVELQDQNDESSSLKSMPPPGDPVKNSNGGIMYDDTVYVTVFKRHYGGNYPYYASEVFDFSSKQLIYSITPGETTDSTQSPATNGMVTFFNQKAYSSGQAKGCPGFLVGDGYEVANYTAAKGSAYKGLDTLRCLELTDVENLTYGTDGSYSLPFLKSIHPGCFSGGNLQQSPALAYYDDRLAIGRQFHGNCGGDYYEPIWAIRKSDGMGGYNYWAFCVDPYQNATSGTQRQWSTINYKILD